MLLYFVVNVTFQVVTVLSTSVFSLSQQFTNVTLICMFVFIPLYKHTFNTFELKILHNFIIHFPIIVGCYILATNSVCTLYPNTVILFIIIYCFILFFILTSYSIDCCDLYEMFYVLLNCSIVSSVCDADTN